MVMESANKSQDQTLGLLQDLKLTIGGYTFYLQVQVVEDAPYELLLGLPFKTLTNMVTRTFSNGDSHITLTDPNTQAMITVPTRKCIRNKPSKDVGFYVSIDESTYNRGDTCLPDSTTCTSEISESNLVEIYLPSDAPTSDLQTPIKSPANLQEPIKTLAYKKVANRIKPVATTLPEQFRIVRRIPSNPLAELPVLPENPPEFEPGIPYTQERKEAMPANQDGFLLPEEEKLVHYLIKIHETA